MIEPITAEELRVVHVHQQLPTEPIIEFERFSKWERLTRSVAFVLRFGCKRMRRNGTKDGKATLGSAEWKRAESAVFKLIQANEYTEECSILQRNLTLQPDKRERIQKSSRVFKLSPFLDLAGVMRMGSRIANAECVSDESKFPVILPKDHYVTKLVIDWYHRKYRHANNETVVNDIRQKLHISDLRKAVKKVANVCNWC